MPDQSKIRLKLLLKIILTIKNPGKIPLSPSSLVAQLLFSSYSGFSTSAKTILKLNSGIISFAGMYKKINVLREPPKQIYTYFVTLIVSDTTS